MAIIDLDISQWPVAIVTTTGAASTEELNQFFERYTKMLTAKAGVYALVLDLRRAADMPPAQRKALTDYMKKQEEVAGKRCAGTALIFESAVMRAILTAIFWVKNPPQEVRVCSTVQEALEWSTGAIDRKRKAA